MRIGVCIPCYAPHLHDLSTCLQSIEQQTRQPDIVSISISSNDGNVPIDVKSYSFPIVVVSTHEIQYAGKNRNIAAANISTDVDILTFFDADDWMHPKRIETIEQHFHQDIDSLVHMFQKGVKNTISFDTYVWPDVSNILHRSSFMIGRDSICGRVWYTDHLGKKELGHCGHFTVRSHIWNTYRYPEHMQMGEDSEYIWNVVTSGSKHAFSPDILSIYM